MYRRLHTSIKLPKSKSGSKGLRIRNAFAMNVTLQPERWQGDQQYHRHVGTCRSSQPATVGLTLFSMPSRGALTELRRKRPACLAHHACSAKLCLSKVSQDLKDRGKVQSRDALTIALHPFTSFIRRFPSLLHWSNQDILSESHDFDSLKLRQYKIGIPSDR